MKFIEKTTVGTKSTYTILGKIRIHKRKRKLQLIKKFYEKSYSQDGEDMVLYSMYEGEGREFYKGFYIDIGAFHPLKFSNTQFFYENGWKGVNIDATPGSMKKFNQLRKRDINIEAGIARQQGTLLYYIFRDNAFNTFNKEIGEYRANNGIELKEKKEIKVYTINELLAKYLPESQKIDFIDIDIEGIELELIKSFDFKKYSPKYFLIEDLNFVNGDFFNYKDAEIYKLLTANGYKIAAKTKRTIIYEKIEA